MNTYIISIYIYIHILSIYMYIFEEIGFKFDKPINMIC